MTCPRLLRPLFLIAIFYSYGVNTPAWADSTEQSVIACDSVSSMAAGEIQPVADVTSPTAGQEVSAHSGHKHGEASMQGKTPIHGVDWIKGQLASCYTLQLMAASSTDTLQHLVTDKSLPEPLAIAASKPDGSGLYLLFQGSYRSSSEAQSASRQIEEMAGVHPWIRQFSSLTNLYDATVAAEKQLLGNPAKREVTINGAAWLWSRNPEHYTVQLMSDNQPKRLRRFVEQTQPGLQTAIVQVELKGKAWYLLLAGDYESVEVARLAIDRLPESLRQAKPWLRSFASLQEQMAAANHVEDWWVSKHSPIPSR